MSTRSIARCGVCVALLACSAWVIVPLGLAPFTMQTFVLALIPQVMGPRESILTVAVYLVLGACGLPVFSGFQGGVGTLLGPTGGYLWGFLLGMAPAAALMRAEALPRRARAVMAGTALLGVSYLFGTVQLMGVYSLSAPVALASGVLPFVVPDVLKVAASISVAESVNRALGAAARN